MAARLTLLNLAWGIVVIVALGLAVASAGGQCRTREDDPNAPPPLPTTTSSTREGEPLLLESGYLSNTTYASSYFGLVLELPIPVEGHRIMLPLMPAGQHALLGLGFQEGRRSGTLVVLANDPPDPYPTLSEEERKQEFVRWSQGTPMRRITPPQSLMRTGRFYHVTRHSGDVTTVQYWTFVKNSLLRMKAESNDPEFLKRVKRTAETASFYCVEDDGTLVNLDGETVPLQGTAYRGPTIPTAAVEGALKDQPSQEIPKGVFQAGVYLNPDLGFEYTPPADWKPIGGELSGPAKDLASSRTGDLMQACSRVLLRVAPPTGDYAKPTGKEITLRALDQACLSLPAPLAVDDHLGAEELGAYLQMLEAFGELRTSGLMLLGGNLFAGYSGTITVREESQRLAARRSQILAITRHRKLLLVWTWSAPAAAEVRAMPTSSVRFENAPAIELVPAGMAKP